MVARLCFVWLLVAALGHTGFAQAPVGWRRLALDSVASVEFPDSVQRKQVEGNDVQVCVSGQTIYMALRRPTSSLLGLFNNSESFNKGMVKGLLQETGGQLLHERPIRVGEFTGVEVQFVTPGNLQLPATKYTRLVAANGTLYNLYYWSNAVQDSAAAAERNRFFASLQLKAESELLPSGAYHLGYVLGKLLAVVLVIGLLLLGAGLLVRRLRATNS